MCDGAAGVRSTSWLWPSGTGASVVVGSGRVAMRQHPVRGGSWRCGCSRPGSIFEGGVVFKMGPKRSGGRCQEKQQFLDAVDMQAWGSVARSGHRARGFAARSGVLVNVVSEHEPDSKFCACGARVQQTRPQDSPCREVTSSRRHAVFLSAPTATGIEE